jgi:hypothetical protein
MRESWATVSAAAAALTELTWARVAAMPVPVRRALAFGLVATLALAALAIGGVRAPDPACTAHAADTGCTPALERQQRAAADGVLRPDLTGYIVSGRVSTYASPLQADGTTADGGSSRRPCIALLDRRTLDRWFLVTIGRHRAVLEHCDSGPYADGRVMDVTGHGALALGIDPRAFPTDAYATAQLLRAKPTGA